ncbi:MAG TPA: sulfatase [Streptosporangiaceae bacterium]|nr:sulfatase [Streptosporangiaceae bacterium]
MSSDLTSAGSSIIADVETSAEPADTVTANNPGGPASRRRRRRVASGVATALACLLVLFALIVPGDLTGLAPAQFVRIPLEGVIGVVLIAVLPPRPRIVVAVAAGIVLGLLAILKIFDIGFYETLDRPFHPVFDWPFLGAGAEFLTQMLGRPGGIAAIAVVALLAVGMVVLMTLSALRLTRIVVRHTAAAVRGAAVLAVAWVACAALGAQLVPGVPVAANAFGRLMQVPADLRDHETFAAQSARDAFRHTPGDRLLTGLRGKDVILAFVESYGRVAMGDPGVTAALDAGNSRLRAAGFGARSAFLTSPTFGGGSWLAHGTLLSGLWIDNQQRYDTLVSSERLTLTKAFMRASWRTVAVMPGNTRPWSEAAFYGAQRVYDHWNMGYRGPGFNWGTPPDQYTMSAFQRLERGAPGRPPVMAEIPLVTSHSPWAPTPHLIEWKNVGDGSVYGPMAAAGDRPAEVWRSPSRVRAAYMRSVTYSLNTLITYMETYGGDDLVLVFLGDHQPAPIVSGPHADHDVPITVVARDPSVLNRISGWGWQDGLRPGARAPVWRMDAFRDRFLTAFS